MALAARSAVLSGLRAPTTARAQRQQQPRRALVVRASEEKPTPSTAATEPEVTETVPNVTVTQAPAAPARAPNGKSLPNTPAFLSGLEAAGAGAASSSLGDLMAFSGPAPELINGRLAMLAFVAALGAEAATGESALRQLAQEPTGVILVALTFITASLIPMLSSTKAKAFGPFTPSAEMLNGRAAMIGFASLLIAEAVRGSALF